MHENNIFNQYIYIYIYIYISPKNYTLCMKEQLSFPKLYYMSCMHGYILYRCMQYCLNINFEPKSTKSNIVKKEQLFSHIEYIAYSLFHSLSSSGTDCSSCSAREPTASKTSPSHEASLQLGLHNSTRLLTNVITDVGNF